MSTKLAAAEEHTGGGLSNPTKMPEPSYNLPPERCPTGSILSRIPGTVCAKCYGRRGRYPFPNVQRCLQSRWNSLSDPKWVDSMTELIKSQCRRFFRWHDVGDIQNMEHFLNILRVVQDTAPIRHWLPTKEIALLLEYHRYIKYLGKGLPLAIPDNLTIRVSSPFINTLTLLPLVGVTYAVCYDHDYASGTDTKPSKTSIKDFSSPIWNCPSKQQGNKCLNCRMCWSRKVTCVAYGLH